MSSRNPSHRQLEEPDGGIPGESDVLQTLLTANRAASRAESSASVLVGRLLAITGDRRVPLVSYP